MSKYVIGLSAVAVALAAAPAFAAVIFDPGTGTGFVGKGDVQLAFGWNNAQLQNNAGGVSFTYDSSQEYDLTCEWDTVTGGKNSKTIHHIVTNHRTVGSTLAVEKVDRKNPNGQITGFNLTGITSSTSTGLPVPEVGDRCHGGENDAGNGNLTAVSQTSSTSGFFVNYGGNSVQLQ